MLVLSSEMSIPSSSPGLGQIASYAMILHRRREVRCGAGGKVTAGSYYRHFLENSRILKNRLEILSLILKRSINLICSVSSLDLTRASVN